MTFIPSTHVVLGEAVIKAACVWYSKDIDDAGLTLDDVQRYFLWRFATARVAEGSRTGVGSEKPRKGIPVKLTSDDRLAVVETAQTKELRVRAEPIKDISEKAYARLRDLLSTGEIVGVIFDETSGRPWSVQRHVWNTEDAETAHERGRMRFIQGYGWVIGPVAISRVELENVLAGRPTRATEPGAISTPSADSTQLRDVGGAPLKFEWDEIWAEIVRRVHDDGLPEKKAHLITAIQEWCEVKYGQHPSPSSLKPKVALVFKALGRED